MTHIVTRLCLRDTACVEVCPVECMVLGHPEKEWPWLYIDPDTCIDCGACVPECPYEAIFPKKKSHLTILHRQVFGLPIPKSCCPTDSRLKVRLMDTRSSCSMRSSSKAAKCWI